MTPMNPNILREKFDIPPEMTLNVYHVEGVNANLLNGFNYFQPSKSEEEHIHFIKQRFEIPDNIKVSSDYVGNSMIDISCEEDEPFSKNSEIVELNGSPAFNDLVLSANFSKPQKFIQPVRLTKPDDILDISKIPTIAEY